VSTPAIADGGLASLTKAEKLLAQASTVADVVDIIDLAEAARMLALKAKLGLAAQNYAALIKLKAERKAGELLGLMKANGELSQGGRPSETSPIVGDVSTLADIGINANQSSRWQEIAERYTDDDLEARAAEAVDQAIELTQAALLREVKGAHVSNNSGHIEWYTPAPFVDAAREVMGGIDLDPCSCKAANKIVGATQFFDETDDGLAQEWSGRVWMNPPYAAGLNDKFCTKLRDEYIADRVTQACVVVNNATETAWFQTLGRVANALCFPSGRISFWRPDRESLSPLQGQAFIYLGGEVADFREIFSQFGFTVTP
jgi:hypothetical protein